MGPGFYAQTGEGVFRSHYTTGEGASAIQRNCATLPSKPCGKNGASRLRIGNRMLI